LQSATARALLQQTQSSSAPPSLDSMIVIDGLRVLNRSDAALAIAARLGAPWRWCRVARIIPRPVRDGIYSLIARNRYRWFGRQTQCMVPTPELQSRFLDARP
jgi:predicted DCC family thiol-disulfide oxidoreductase YuxK